MGFNDFPPRLKRLDRLFTTHPLYFVTTNTQDRKPLLANAKIHEEFRAFCRGGLARGVFVGKYVLMPDHLHLFVAFGEEFESKITKRRLSNSDVANDAPSFGGHRPPLQKSEALAGVGDRSFSPLSEWMKSLKNSLSKTLRDLNIPSPHWQKGFFDHVMRSEESYSEKWFYVAQNPVRKNLTPRVEDWPYQGEIYPLAARGHLQ